MPTYDYRCPEGHEFEEFHSMSSDQITVCPKCGKTAQRQIGGGSGLMFKGTGFYITDYKKANTSGGEAKKEPKPEKKKDP